MPSKYTVDKDTVLLKDGAPATEGERIRKSMFDAVGSFLKSRKSAAKPEPKASPEASMDNAANLLKNSDPEKRRKAAESLKKAF